MRVLALITILILLVVAVVFILNKEPADPQDFVENKTVENYSTFLYSYEIVRYPSNVEIKPAEEMDESVLLGFVVDPWNINFGIIPSNGSYATRTIEVANLEDRDNEVILKAFGNISDLIVFSKNRFVLKPEDKSSIEIFMYSKDSLPGNYTGEIDVLSKKPIYNFLPII
jgi:hypothetical protein